jgi:NitT/TauT family transport system substrate-binding protein
MKSSARIAGMLVGAALVAAACSSSATPAASSAAAGGASAAALIPVKLQLQWVPQAQFAGYYAAVDQGYYKDAGLDVTILAGGPDVNNLQVVASGGADLGVSWVPKTLQSREGGTDLVWISQILQRSGTRMVSFKDRNILAPKDLAGKKIGSWLGGNEPELFAAMTKAGLDPTKENVIKQNFDMVAFVQGDLDAAQAMVYNEYAQVLETKNPKTGALFTPADLNVMDFNDPSIGTAMLQDGVFAKDSWLKQGTNADTATKFLTATFKGWIFCRDNAQKCADIVTKAGSQLGASHQLWMMNEINALIWPSPSGIGQIDPTLWSQTVDIATKYGILKAAPATGAYRTDLTQAALAALGSSVDTKGTSFQKLTVTLNEGGK